MRRPVRWAIALAVTAMAIPALHLSVRAVVWVDRLLTALAFVTAIILAASISEAFAQSARERRRP